MCLSWMHQYVLLQYTCTCDYAELLTINNNIPFPVTKQQKKKEKNTAMAKGPARGLSAGRLLLAVELFGRARLGPLLFRRL